MPPSNRGLFSGSAPDQAGSRCDVIHCTQVSTMSSTTLSIRLNAETKAKLDALAKLSRRSKSFLAAEAIENFVAAESWQLEEIEAGIKDLDANRTVDHGEVRLASLLEKGRHPPARAEARTVCFGELRDCTSDQQTWSQEADF